MDYPNFDSIDFNFKRSLVTLMDFPVALLFIVLALFLFNQIRRRNPNLYGAKPTIFFSALMLHCLLAVFITLIYSYYYNGGDTTAYFNDARLLHKIFWHNPKMGLEILFSNPESLLEHHRYIYYSFRFLKSADTFMMVRICFFVQFFSFSLIIPTALIFSFISFYAFWKFYSVLCYYFPQNAKHLTIPIFFIPGIHVWGSGIFKDTVSLIAVYCIVILIIRMRRGLRIMPLLGLLLFTYLLFVIKIYVLMILALGMFCFFIFYSSSSIKNSILRLLIAPFFVFVGLAGLFLTVDYIGENSEKGIYSKEQILERAKIVSNYLVYVSDKSEGSTYSLGIQDFTIPSLISKIPAAINVTLFRPYLWEVSNPLMLASALESMLIMVFTIYVFFKVGMINFFSRIYASPLIISMLIYCFLFSFAIGIVSSNFGTLVRYKTPIIPFFIIALLLIRFPQRGGTNLR